MKEKPKRIQRKRTKGWRKPRNAVYVGGPTIFANPFDWRKYGRKEAVAKFEAWVGPHGEELFPSFRTKRHWLLRAVPDLRGKDLCCWCPLSQPCHADVLLRLANEDK